MTKNDQIGPNMTKNDQNFRFEIHSSYIRCTKYHLSRIKVVENDQKWPNMTKYDQK